MDKKECLTKDELLSTMAKGLGKVNINSLYGIFDNVSTLNGYVLYNGRLITIEERDRLVVEDNLDALGL